MNSIKKKNIAVELIKEYTNLDYTKKDKAQPKTFFITTRSEPKMNFERILFETVVYINSDEEFRELFDLGFDLGLRKLGFGVSNKYYDENQSLGFFTLDTFICEG